jgi:Flp pilus assembly CpaF family ATPase
MLGWPIMNEGEYKLKMPTLSKQEVELILASYEHAKEIARTSKTGTKEDSKKIIEQAIKNSASDNFFYLSDSQSKYLSDIAFMHIYGFGFLEQLIEDNEIEEISIIGPHKPAYVYVRGQGWKSINACFENVQAIADVINKMARGLGRHITMQNPRLDAILPNGSRLHASLPPISNGEITIRKFRQHPFSPKELCETCGIVSIEAMALLSMVMQCDFSAIIAGNTASGKTTTMNALFAFVPANERVVITEETPEINIPHEHQLRLIANKDMDITLKDLVYDSLRMRPDRMIVGEVRNAEEAEALFDVLLAGQARGSYATFHSQSAGEVLTRLAAFGVGREDAGCIDCIIVQRRILEYDSAKRESRERRRITEIAEVVDGRARAFYRNGKLDLNDVELVEKIGKQFGLRTNDLQAELKYREKIIANAPLDYGSFFRMIQGELYGGNLKVRGNREAGCSLQPAIGSQQSAASMQQLELGTGDSLLETG